jgi:hypothetical protein
LSLVQRAGAGAPLAFVRLAGLDDLGFIVGTVGQRMRDAPDSNDA